MDVSKKETPNVSKSLRKRKHEETQTQFDYSDNSLKKAYSKKLPITKLKKRDLLKMCTEKNIPAELHPWYNSLPDKDGPDYLPEDEISDSEH